MADRPEKPVLVREEDGPYVQAALFCERALEEKDGVLSFIRVVDRLISQAVGPGAPEKMPPAIIQVTLVVVLKAGFAKGSYSITVKGQTPSGRPMPPITLPILLEGDDRGAGIAGQINLQVDEDGLYWFDVLFEQRFMTRMPLRIVYQRLTTTAGPM